VSRYVASHATGADGGSHSLLAAAYWQGSIVL
jgi:hypothetical protein